MAPSYQLPDLPSLCSPFELRANRFCRSATRASEAWLLNLRTHDMNNALTQEERDMLHPIKTGLLAAVYFPGYDYPQLLFLTNFMSLLFLSARRLRKPRHLDQSGWVRCDSACDSEGQMALARHELFQYIQPDLDRYISGASSGWRTRFMGTVEAYRAAQLQMLANIQTIQTPDPESYVSLRCDLSGVYMLLDLAQLADNSTFPPLDQEASDKFSRLKQYTAEIITCSLDVVAFNNDQAQGYHHNLISVSMNHNGLSIQGALNFAGTMIKQKVNAFLATEQALIDSLTLPPSDPSGNAPSYWSWTSSLGVATTPCPPSPPGPVFLEDLPNYIRTLKDCIVGTLHWAYETELYFGTKGEEIRTFGWVFLTPKNNAEHDPRQETSV